MSGSWKHDANRRPFENVLDAGAAFGTTQHDPTASVRTLQIPIRRTILTHIWRARRTQPSVRSGGDITSNIGFRPLRQVFFAPDQMTELSHCIAIEQDQNPANPSGLL